MRVTARRGMTLVELLIMSFVALVLMTVMWSLFSGGMRHFRSTDTKLKGVQAAQLLVEHLHDDLDRICWDEAHPLLGAGQDGPESFLTVSFFEYDRKAKPGKLAPTPTAVQVSYRFDRATRRVLRNDQPFTFAHFEQVRFKFQPANTKDPFKSGDPKNPPSNSLLYWVSAASDEKLAAMDEAPDSADPAAQDRRGITTLFGAVALRAKASADQYPGWVENGPDVAVTGQ